MSKTTGRNLAGLATLGVIAVLIGAINVWNRADSQAAESGRVDGRDLETLTLDDVRPPRPPATTRRIAPERPTVIPPVDVGNGLVVKINSVFVSPSFNDESAFLTSRPNASTRPSVEDLRQPTELRQRVMISASFTDPAPPHEQDHILRIAGVVSNTGISNFSFGASRIMTMASATVDAQARHVLVEVSVPSGPPIEVERMAPGDAAPTRGPNAPAVAPWRLFSVEELKGTTIAVLSQSEASDDELAGRSWTLHAVCHDGRIVLPGSVLNSMRTGMEVQFRVPLKDVAYVVYRCRPYEWRPVGEVPLPETEYVVTSPYHDGPVKATSIAEVSQLYRQMEAAATQRSMPANLPSGNFHVKSKNSSVSFPANRSPRPRPTTVPVRVPPNPIDG